MRAYVFIRSSVCINLLTICTRHWCFQSAHGCVRSPPAPHTLQVLKWPLHVSSRLSAAFRERDPWSVLMAPHGTGPVTSQKGLEHREDNILKQSVLSSHAMRDLFLLYTLYILL